MTYSKYVDMQSKINYTFVRLNISMLVEIGLVRVSNLVEIAPEYFLITNTFSLYFGKN